jgi:hypothetical protein
MMIGRLMIEHRATAGVVQFAWTRAGLIEEGPAVRYWTCSTCRRKMLLCSLVTEGERGRDWTFVRMTNACRRVTKRQAAVQHSETGSPRCEDGRSRPRTVEGRVLLSVCVRWSGPDPVGTALRTGSICGARMLHRRLPQRVGASRVRIPTHDLRRSTGGVHWVGGCPRDSRGPMVHRRSTAVVPRTGAVQWWPRRVG